MANLHLVTHPGYLFAALSLALTLGGCKPEYAPEQPVATTPSACCTVVSEDMKQGAGCEVRKRCTKDQTVWLQGAVTCSAVDDTQCQGGRCCKFKPRYGTQGAELNWAPGVAPGVESSAGPNSTETAPAPAEPPADEG